jgi:hypothetical protein
MKRNALNQPSAPSTQGLKKLKAAKEEVLLEVPFASENADSAQERAKWARQALPKDFNPKTTSVVFQQLVRQYEELISVCLLFYLAFVQFLTVRK